MNRFHNIHESSDLSSDLCRKPKPLQRGSRPEARKSQRRDNPLAETALSLAQVLVLPAIAVAATCFGSPALAMFCTTAAGVLLAI